MSDNERRNLSTRKTLRRFTCWRALGAVVALSAVLVTNACANNDSGKTAPSGLAGKSHYTIAIALIASIGVIDDNVAAFKAELARNGFVEGKNVTYVTKNAQGEMSNVSLVAQAVVSSKPDLIFTAGTDLDVAIAKLTKTIPILFSTATYPKEAGLVRNVEKPGGNTTGTSDFIDPATYFKYLQAALPDARRVGLMGNTGEANSGLQLKAFASQAKSLGLTPVTVPVANSNEIAPGIQSLAGRVDVLLIGADSTLTSTDKVVIKQAMAKHIPVVFNGTSEAANGALVGIGPDYAKLGTISGTQATKILKGSSPAEMPVAYPGPLSLIQVAVNTKSAQALGITLSEPLLGEAQVVSE